MSHELDSYHINMRSKSFHKSLHYRNLIKMKVFIVLCIVIAPILGQLIQPTESVPPAVEYTPPQISPRVVNGQNAAATQFPWQVSIQPLNSAGAAIVRCSGSLISSNRVLTVAHCVRDYASFRISMGSVNINTQQITQTVSRFNVVVHPRFNNMSLNGDIAIVKLNSDVPLSSTVKTIRLPRRAQNVLDYFARKTATVSGWGRTTDSSNTVSDVLRFANLNVTTNAYCKQIYGSAVILNSTICGIGIPATSGPCGGDSGSPLVLVDADAITTQIGLFSFVSGMGCGMGYPAGFTFIAPYLDWISQNTGIPIRA